MSFRKCIKSNMLGAFFAALMYILDMFMVILQSTDFNIVYFQYSLVLALQTVHFINTCINYNLYITVHGENSDIAWKMAHFINSSPKIK